MSVTDPDGMAWTDEERAELAAASARARSYGGMTKYTCAELEEMSMRQLGRVERGLPPGRRHWWSIRRGEDS